ncbi:MAG: hypothetical protein Q9222_002126 [Ikaeria aurantiellina]
MNVGHGSGIEQERKASLLPMTTADDKTSAPKDGNSIHAAFYVAAWMTLSCVLIVFNKWILDQAKYPILLTFYHMALATATTQTLARTTNILDSRHSVQMTPKLYMTAIVPIGVLFSLSLVFSNLPYLYLSVAFIQMLKGTAPIAVFLALWSLRLDSPTLSRLLTLCVIVCGIGLASFGEIKFQITGFVFQMSAVVFEAYRLALIQKLLSNKKYKMDPLVSLYYFAPCCAGMISIMGLSKEWRNLDWHTVQAAGIWLWASNGIVAMGLNVAGVLLIGKTSSLVLTLCGVLKGLIIIGTSIVIWDTVVTPTQFVGNGIAMAGLVYYNLGGERAQGVCAAMRTFWNDMPATVRFLVLVGLGLNCFALLASMVEWSGMNLDPWGFLPGYAGEEISGF